MKILNISQVDSVFADGSYPIELLFFYKLKLKTERIRRALKKLSTTFWPLFGEYQAGQIRFNRYNENEYYDEMVLNEQFDTTLSYNALYEKYSRINPPVMQKLFHLAIIQYSNGTILIPKMNHLAGDGYSYFYFLTALASVMRDPPIPFKAVLTRLLYKPHHYRTILRKFLFTERGLKQALPDSQFTISYEELPREEIQQTIRDIKSRHNLTISANDLLSAISVKKLFSQQKDFIHDSMQLTIPMDVRRQIPEYGRRYFGNALLFKTITFPRQTLRESEVNIIAMDIRKSIPAMTKEGYITYLKELEKLITDEQFEKLKPYNPAYGCLVTNLTKMPAEHLDFGTGNPDFIFPLTIEKNSAALLSHHNNYILRLAY